MNIASAFKTKLLIVCASFSLAACGGDDEPEPTPNEWNGKTYSLTIGLNDWTQPAGIEQDVGPYVPQFLFSVSGADAGSYQALTGTAEASVQDTCNRTVSVPGANGSIGPVNFPMHIRQSGEENNSNPPTDVVVNTTMYNVSFTNVLPKGGAVSTTGTFRGTLDGREVIPLFHLLGAGRTADILCETLADQPRPVMCEPCPSDNALYCLTLVAEEIGAVEHTGAPVQPVDSLAASCNAP